MARGVFHSLFASVFGRQLNRGGRWPKAQQGFPTILFEKRRRGVVTSSRDVDSDGCVTVRPADYIQTTDQCVCVE